MGNTLLAEACCNNGKKNLFKELEKTKYEANSDKFLISVEKKYNLLQYVPFQEYYNALINFNEGSGTISTNMDSYQSKLDDYGMLEEPISEEAFSNFMESKIIPLDCLYNFRLEKNNKILTIFRDILSETYKNLEKNYIKYSDDKRNIIRKHHLLALGFLYCKGQKYVKIESFFKIFKGKKDNFPQTTQLNNFLLGLFLIPSCCLVYVRMKLGIKYLNFGEIAKSDILFILSAFELKDIERLLMIFYKAFFELKTEMTHEEFIQKFVSKNFGWLFQPSGIRFYLEKYNDTDDDDDQQAETISSID